MTANSSKWQSLYHVSLSISQYQNVSILDFIGVKDDGGGEWWQLEL